MLPLDTEVCGHTEKEQVLWDDFKLRLGTSEFSDFCVDPNFFIQRVDDLSFLEGPFCHAEIDNIIKALPYEKSLGPDGFNNEFLKKS
jgi:hypothetical protein